MMTYSNNTFVSYNLSPAQSKPLQPTLQAQAQRPRPIKQVHSMCPPYIVTPSFYHPTGTSFSVTYVDKMTVDQTSNWVWTLGRFKGWAEAETYAKKFKENSISGQSLPDLTAEMLKCYLGISNVGHRLELIATIQQLFPSITVGNNTPELSTGTAVFESTCVSKYDGRVRSLESDCKCTNSYIASTYSTDGGAPVQMSCSGVMSWSVYSKCSTVLDYYSGSEHNVSPMTSGGSSSQFVDYPDGKFDVIMSDKPVKKGRTAVSFRNRPWRGRKLILTLRPDQILQDWCTEIERIRSRFEEVIHTVEVVPCENKPNTYIVVFPNPKQACEALSKADEIGYNLAKQWPPRPGPRSPIKFKSMANLTIQVGKSLKGKVVGELKEDKIVTVNQVKGRRARLIEEKENGQTVTIGWVSVHGPDGTPLLMQLGDY